MTDSQNCSHDEVSLNASILAALPIPTDPNVANTILQTLEAYLARRKSEPALPRIKVSRADGTATATIGDGNPVDRMKSMLGLGTVDAALYEGLLGGISGIAKSDEELNFMVSAIRAIRPTDGVEIMLAAQMAAIHGATMTAARRLARSESIPQYEANERALNKLARTYAGQVESLKRYRVGGQQKVTVEHVTVNAGGQAIVGAVSNPGTA